MIRMHVHRLSMMLRLLPLLNVAMRVRLLMVVMLGRRHSDWAQLVSSRHSMTVTTVAVTMTMVTNDSSLLDRSLLHMSRRRSGRSGSLVLEFLDRDAHVSTVSSFSTVSLVFADAAVCTDARVSASTARSLTIAAFLALSAALAARLGREIFFVGCEGLMAD